MKYSIEKHLARSDCAYNAVVLIPQVKFKLLHDSWGTFYESIQTIELNLRILEITSNF